MPDPDDLDRQLRDLTSGLAEPPKFTELSAAERLRRLPGPPAPPPVTRRSQRKWRSARKARQLRKPTAEPGPKRGTGPGSAKRRPGIRGMQARPAPNAANRRKRRLLTIVKTVGVVVAFAALLYGLHLLGFGPQ